MSDADQAYTAAETAIARARASGADELDFNSKKFRALDRLPPEIGTLSNLQRLDLDHTQVADITPLQTLTNLQKLVLFDTQVADIAPLQTLTKLKRLILANTQVTEITALQTLTNLAVLNLDTTQVTDIAPLQTLTNLWWLGLENTQVTDITPLQTLTNLHTLYLNNTQVTDIAPLQTPTNINRLNLNSTQVADLRPIADLPRLGEDDHTGLWFMGTPAARATPDLTRLSEIEDPQQRAKDTQAYLKTLPPYPQPLPWEEDAGSSIQSGAKHDDPLTSAREGVNPPYPKAIPKRITVSQARRVLETQSKDLREQCQFVTEQLNQTLANQIPPKPNDAAALADWTQLVNTLELSRSAITALHGALPEQASDKPVTEDDANRLKQAFETAIATLQKASAYIDGPGEAHGRTYAGLLKIGVCSALAAPIALISAQPLAPIGGGLYAMLYGKGAALDVVKAIGSAPGPKSDTIP